VEEVEVDSSFLVAQELFECGLRVMDGWERFEELVIPPRGLILT
jgi:hypothetical protein